MEFLEIVLDLKTVHLDSIIFKEFKLTADKIKTSHFYDHIEEKDKEFHEIVSFPNYL